MDSIVLSIDEAFEDLVKAEGTKAQRSAAKKYALSEKTKETIGTAGSKAREDMPADMFLKPGERKYPWKLGGKPSQKLLVAAYRRAITQKDAAVANKARRLLKQHFDKEFQTIGKAMDLILANWDKAVELFEKARTPGAKDIKKRKRKLMGQVAYHPGSGKTGVVTNVHEGLYSTSEPHVTVSFDGEKKKLPINSLQLRKVGKAMGVD